MSEVNDDRNCPRCGEPWSEDSRALRAELDRLVAVLDAEKARAERAEAVAVALREALVAARGHAASAVGEWRSARAMHDIDMIDAALAAYDAAKGGSK